MSGGGSRTVQTQSASNSPWGPSQDYLKTGMAEADKLYKAGTGSQIYEGKTYVDRSGNTQAGIDGILTKARGSDTTSPFSAISKNIETLSPIANGDFSNDTTFNQTLGRAQDDIAHQVNMGASAAGRYGSAVHQGAVGEAVGDVTNRAMLDRQNWALQGLHGSVAQLPAAYQSQFLPEQTQMQIGAMDEDLAALKLNDDLRVFNEQQNKPWENLGRFNAIVSGAGSLGGTSTSSVQQPRNNGAVFGNALQGYAAGGPVGAGIGLLSGLF